MAKASLSAGVSRELAVFVSNLHKSYGSVQAVCGIDLEIIEWLKMFDSGGVRVLGMPPRFQCGSFSLPASWRSWW